MTTLFPDALDDFTNPSGSQSQAAVRTHSQQHGDLNDAVEAVQAAIGTTGAPGPFFMFQAEGVGSVQRTMRDKAREIVSVEDFGAVGDGVTDDTVAIQKAIDQVASAGGGELWFGPKEYIVTRSVLTDGFDSGVTAADVCALLWRSGVFLRGRGIGVTTIHCTNLASSVIASYSLESGGIYDMTVKNDSTGSNGAGHGILLSCAAGLLYNRNITIRNVESCNHGSYGIAAQKGQYSNNLYDGIYVHDVGADGIDHKVRSGATPFSRGVRFSNIVCERYGQRVDDSAGIDIRGPATIVNFHARNFGKAGFINWGFRFNAGTYTSDDSDTRESSNYSSLSNFFIESSPEFSTGGITINNAQGIEISNGTIIGTTFRGVRVGVVASGVDVGRNVSLTNVYVQGVRGGSAFITGWERARFINCISRGEVHEFKEVRGNLAAAQTVFVATFDPATVQVYKNAVLLTGGGVDYTVGGSTTITLAAGVLVSDVIEIVTPNAIGWEITSSAPDCFAANCAAQHTTTPFLVDAAIVDTFSRIGNSTGTGGIRAVETTSKRLEMWGPTADIDFRLDCKGAGAFETRSNGARALVAMNDAPGNANWPVVKGSAAGVGVELTAAGNSAAIDIKLAPKGTGNITTNLGAVKNFASDAAAAAGGVPIGGFYRNGSAVQIRIA